MLKGLRIAIKYFALGLLGGLLLAPRKGSETFRLLIGRGKEYVKESLNVTVRARRDSEE
jgi:hypothetical protein